MNRLNALLRRLGVVGVIGIGVLLSCVPFYFNALRPAQDELAAQREAAERLRARGPYRPVAADNRSDALRRFYALFPPVEDLPDELERVYALAREAKLELVQGEYRLEKRTVGPLAYRVTLPVRGAYAQIRSFLAAVLKEIPIASVDALRFERKKSVDTQIDAQVRLTIHFQPREKPETR